MSASLESLVFILRGKRELIILNTFQIRDHSLTSFDDGGMISVFE